MCSHGNTKKINGVKVCLRCGFTILPNNKFIFDKNIVNYKPKRKKAVKT